MVTNYDIKLQANHEYQNDVLASKIKVAVNDILEEFGGTTTNKLAIVVDPPVARSVRALRDIKEGDLKLVPVSNTVNFAKPNTQIPESGLAICTTNANHIAYLPPKLPVQKKDAPPTTERGKAMSEFIVPFWCVKPEADHQAANMSFQNIKTRIGNSTVIVPVLTNNRPLKPEDVLSLYVPGGATTKWPIPDDTEVVDAPKKRARRSTGAP